MIGKNIYDISMDEMRAATQEDVDQYAKALQVSGKMVRVLRHLAPGLVPDAGPRFLDELDAWLDAFMKDNDIQT